MNELGGHVDIIPIFSPLKSLEITFLRFFLTCDIYVILQQCQSLNLNNAGLTKSTIENERGKLLLTMIVWSYLIPSPFLLLSPKFTCTHIKIVAKRMKYSDIAFVYDDIKSI